VIIGLFCLACIGAVVLAAFEPILKKLYTPEAWAEREAKGPLDPILKEFYTPEAWAEREAQEAEREAKRRLEDEKRVAEAKAVSDEREARTQAALKRLREEGGS